MGWKKFQLTRIFSYARVNTLGVTTMKRFIVTTILTVVIAGVLAHFMPRSFEYYLPEFGADATVSIYCRGTELDGVDMGGAYKVTCNAQAFRKTATQCHGIDGVSVSFAGSLDDVYALAKFFRLKSPQAFEQDGLYVVCGKSSKIRSGVLDGGKLVNLQIAYKDSTVHLGSPLILGDY